MDQLLQTATQYGALGVTLFATFWYINNKDKEHREERKELVDKLASLHTESLEVTKNNTQILIEISTIIKQKA